MMPYLSYPHRTGVDMFAHSSHSLLILAHSSHSLLILAHSGHSLLILVQGVEDPIAVLKHIFFAGLCFHTYQQVSYMILQKVSPVTHSIGNCESASHCLIASEAIRSSGIPLSHTS